VRRDPGIPSQGSKSSPGAPIPAGEPARFMERWQRIARRIRVPLGFVTAGLYLFELWRRTPHTAAIAWSVALVGPGLWLRGYASGYVKKNRELAVTGPYAYTRNPLYLGSMLIAAGFAVALGSWAVGAVLAAGFAVIYIPTIASEERFLRATFAEFDEYCRRVPRLIPRLGPIPMKSAEAGELPDPGRKNNDAARVEKPMSGGFSFSLYLKHREYNALLGAALLYASLLYLRPVANAILPGIR
jgi:protein-S-isoprenylcysteine O-methyltransferase Ste14